MIDSTNFEQEQKNNSWCVWNNLYKMQRLHAGDDNNYDLIGFIDWMEENFGIKFFFSKAPEVLEDYCIVDEKKYMYYVLKHT